MVKPSVLHQLLLYIYLLLPLWLTEALVRPPIDQEDIVLPPKKSMCKDSLDTKNMSEPRGNLRTATERWLSTLIHRDNTCTTLKENKTTCINSLTNLKIGPPSFLNQQDKIQWRSLLHDTLAICTKDILIKAMDQNLWIRWHRLIKVISHKVVEGEDWTSINEEIKKGLEKANNSVRKTDIKKDVFHKQISFYRPITTPQPPPPLPTILKQSSPIEATEIPQSNENFLVVDRKINSLTRGEFWAPLKTPLVIEDKVTSSSDPLNAIAWAIFGRKHRCNLIRVATIKYLKWYKTIEKDFFKDRKVTTWKDKIIHIISWEQGMQLLERNEYVLEKQEFQIIAKLYQSNIRIYRRNKKIDKREVFICTWQTGKGYTRMINLLADQDKWLLLRKKGGKYEKQKEVEFSNRAESNNIVRVASNNIVCTSLDNQVVGTLNSVIQPFREDITASEDSKFKQASNTYNISEEKPYHITKAMDIDNTSSILSSVEEWDCEDLFSEEEGIDLIDSYKLKELLNIKQKEIDSTNDIVNYKHIEIARELPNETLKHIHTIDPLTNNSTDSEDRVIAALFPDSLLEEKVNTIIHEKQKEAEFFNRVESNNIVRAESNETAYASIDNQAAETLNQVIQPFRKDITIPEDSKSKKTTNIYNIPKEKPQYITNAMDIDSTSSKLSSVAEWDCGDLFSEEEEIDLIDSYKLKELLIIKQKEIDSTNEVANYKHIEITKELTNETPRHIHTIDPLTNKTTYSEDSVIAALFPDSLSEEENTTITTKSYTQKSRRRTCRQKWRNLIRSMRRKATRKKLAQDRKTRTQEESTRLVFDFTSNKLTPNEIELLGKGESFCLLNHKIEEDSFKVDLYKYQRRLRLHEKFKETINADTDNRHSIRRSTRLSIDYNNITHPVATRQSHIENRTIESVIPTTNNIIRNNTSYNHTPEEVSTTQVRIRNNRRVSIEDNRYSYNSHNRQSIHNIIHPTITSRTNDTPNQRNRAGFTNITPNRRSLVHNTPRRSHILGDRHITQIQTPNIHTVERRLPSSYDPISNNRNLDRYNTCIQEECLLAIKKKVAFNDNISKELRKSFKTLNQRIAEKEIIIAKADKGSGLVAVDYKTYIEKGTKYIEQEAQAYTKTQETEEHIIMKIVKRRDTLVKEMKTLNIISAQTATFCTKQLEEKITGMKFYYKIHKDRNIATMPLRPLQSCIAAPTHHLSLVLTDILQPLLNDKHIPSFIFDSNQLLFRLQTLNNIPQDSTLISSDVSALYPSIPHEKGLSCMSDFLKDKTVLNKPQIKIIIQALRLVITENYVQWNNDIYKQTSGVAMGTPVAVAYANIFMHWVDKQIRIKATFIHDHIRYIDDNLFILPKDKIDLLMDIANNILPPHIKFTYEQLQTNSDKGLPFLDTQLFISNNQKIESRLYTKQTDRHAYLLPTSFHPPHITKNIPASVFSRIKRICSKEEWFVEDSNKAIEWLEKRGYKKKHILNSLQTIKQKDRWELILDIEKKRDKKPETEQNEFFRIPIIFTYNQHMNRLKDILSDRQNLLDNSFSKTKVTPRLVFRRQRSIGDLLVQKSMRGPIKNIPEEDKIFSNCGERLGYRVQCPCKGRHRQDICRCCIHSKLDISGIKTRIFKPVNCKSKNIVYLIGCKICNLRYVGETQQKLRDRLIQHLNNIDKLNQPLYIHFKHTHSASNLFISVLETVKSNEPIFRKIREAWWINELQTLEPKGLNVKLDCYQIYTDHRNAV